SVADALMFFRLGDFFELFGEDAVKASPLLEVQLTSRDRSDEPIPMCGVPFHAWENYAEKLLARGYKIAVADQVEESGAKKKIGRSANHSHSHSRFAHRSHENIGQRAALFARALATQRNKRNRRTRFFRTQAFR